MPSRLNASALPPVDGAAVLAAPSIFGQSRHFFAEGMVDRDAEPIFIHPCHHATKVQSMIRATFQNIVLPLMDHFMRQRRQGFVVLTEFLSPQQDGRKFDATSAVVFVGYTREGMPRADSAHKHTGRGGESPTPFDANGRQGAHGNSGS